MRSYIHTYIHVQYTLKQKDIQNIKYCIHIKYSYCAPDEVTGPASEGCAVTGSAEAADPVSTVDSSLLVDPVT